MFDFKKFVGRTLVACAVVGTCLSSISADKSSNLNEGDKIIVKNHVVKSGDTFWGITTYYRDKDARDMYLLEYQDEIRKLNPDLAANQCQVKPNDIITVQYVEKVSQ